MARDFRNKKFTKVLRGYADTEVDSYIAFINEEYRKLERAKAESDRKLVLAIQKIDDMNHEIAEQSLNLTELTGIIPERADAIRKAEEDRKLRDEAAEQDRIHAAELLREAEEKLAQAETIREEAAEAAEAILTQAHAEKEQAESEAENARATAEKLYGEVCAFRDTLFELYNTHIESVETIAGEAENFIRAAESPELAEPQELQEPEAFEASEEIPELPEEIPELPEEIPELPEEVPEPKVEIMPDGDLLVELPEEEDLCEADKETAENLWEEEGFTELDDGDEAEEPEEEEPEEPAEAIPEETDFAQTGDSGNVQNINLSELIRQNREGKSGKAKKSDFAELDQLFSAASDEQSGKSLEDAFNEIYGGSGHKSVEEIRRQPTVVPEEPKNPKKHKKF